MTTVAVYLVVVMGLGAFAHVIRLPPLLGFLAAGFILNGLGVQRLDELELLSELGVTLLLFGIGLKLDLRTLLGREVWAAGTIHMAVSAVGGALMLWLMMLAGLELAGETPGTVFLVAFALSFSSTVLVVKILDERGESNSLYGRVAVGILVLQDIAAVLYLTISSSHLPSPWALLVLALLWPVTRLARVLWSRLGHGELLALFGVVMALVPGWWAFTVTGLKGDLGALLVGVLLASHPLARDLAKSILTVKDLLLVGFFVSIGFYGLPSVEMLVMAVILCLLIPMQSAAMAATLTLCGLRRRTAVRGALALANYSEFALIVGSTAVVSGQLDDDWLVMLACAVALSFVVSTVLNRRGSMITNALLRAVPEAPQDKLHPEDRPLDLTRADVLVMGMGRVGTATYDEFTATTSHKVVGLEIDPLRAHHLWGRGYDVENADATDADVWDRISATGHVKIAVLAMPFHDANLSALKELHHSDFAGRVAAVAQYEDQVSELEKLGVDTVINLYSGAGLALAVEAQEDLEYPDN